MTYQVAVPSYNRAQGLLRKTLTTVLNGGVPATAVTVFTHDNDPQLEEYFRIAQDTGVTVKVTSARGIIDQRAEISRHYAAGTCVVTMDDDVRGFERAASSKRLEPVSDVNALFETMFRQTEERKLKVWGLYPVRNAFYMTPGTYREGLRFLIFTTVGFISRPWHPVHDASVTAKDDYEFSLRAWWFDGAVLRNEGVTARADVYTGEGGLLTPGVAHARTPERVERAVTSLMHQWPGLVRRNTRRAQSHFPEIVLASRKRHSGNGPSVAPPGLGKPQ